ncbi:MAG: hypothetical protein Q8M83_01990 [bacterium]|nr:hypothetical protein [bacterium]
MEDVAEKALKIAMNSDFLAKIVRFVKEKGEKFIIVGQDGKDAVVVMPFSEYEKGFSISRANPLTQESEVDKINLEIGASEKRPGSFSAPKNMEDWGGNESLEGNDDRYYMEPLE